MAALNAFRKRWGMFTLTLLGYLMVDVGKVIGVWVSALDKSISWDAVPWTQKITLVALLLAGIGQTFLAVKSRSFSDAINTPVVSE